VTPALEITFALGVFVGFALGMACAHLFLIDGTKPRNGDAPSNEGGGGDAPAVKGEADED
jgi:hypothetical protein